MTGLLVFLAGAAVAYAASKRFGVPPIPLLLLVGIVLARLNLLPRAILQEALVLGLTFLLFVAGLELSPRRIGPLRWAAVRVGVLQFFLLGLAGLLTAAALGFDPLTSAYLGLALTASSTLVVVRVLRQRKQLFEPFGRLVLGVLLVQDALVILLIPLLMRAPAGVDAVARGLAGTLVLVVLAYLCLRWVASAIVRLQREEEVLLLAVVALLFVFVGSADLLGLPLAVGAFLAGVSLSPFPARGIVRTQLASVTDFFTAIFFLALGALLTTPDLRVLLQAALLAAVVVVVTPPLVAWVAERTGMAARPALEGGLLLSQTSELSLVVGLHALAAGQVAQDTFTILALVTVFTMFLTPFLATEPVVRALLRVHPSTRPRKGLPPPSGHVLLLGCGSGGLPLLETMLASGEDVVVVDDDPEVVARLRAGDVRCVRGDASDPEVLREAGAERAKLVSSTIRRPRDNARLLETVRGVPVVVRVFDEADARWVEERGGTAILYSEAAAEGFREWFASRYPSSSPSRAEQRATPSAQATDGSRHTE